MIKQELFDAVKTYEFIPLIEKLESINFKGIFRLSRIKDQVHSIKLCKNILVEKPSEITHCPHCGDLKELSLFKNDVEKKKSDIIKNLGSIVARYVEKLDSLYSIEEAKREYGKHQTLDKYTAQHHPDLIDKVIQLIVILRDDWGANSAKLMDLIEDLYPIINKFITVERPRVKPRIKPKRVISLNNVISNISRNLALSGYSNMTITQFQNVFNKELQKIKNEYDEIIVK